MQRNLLEIQDPNDRTCHEAHDHNSRADSAGKPASLPTGGGRRRNPTGIADADGGILHVASFGQQSTCWQQTGRYKGIEMAGVRLDEIGYWSEIKLDIVRKYAQAYSTVLASDHRIRGYIYIDAFAGAGMHISKRTGEFVPGSPLNALNVEPPFSEYHFIDLNGNKAEHLRQLAGDAPNTHFYNEDCNSVLLNKVFARARWSDYRRALCLLDP
jgi:hypothetical protein